MARIPGRQPRGDSPPRSRTATRDLSRWRPDGRNRQAERRKGARAEAPNSTARHGQAMKPAPWPRPAVPRRSQGADLNQPRTRSARKDRRHRLADLKQQRAKPPIWRQPGSPERLRLPRPTDDLRDVARGSGGCRARACRVLAYQCARPTAVGLPRRSSARQFRDGVTTPAGTCWRARSTRNRRSLSLDRSLSLEITTRRPRHRQVWPAGGALPCSHLSPSLPGWHATP
jgi:hypothetical protein